MVFKPVGVDENGKFAPRIEEVLSTTYSSKPDVYLDPRDFTNGPVTKMSTGETIQTWGVATPTITNGKISYTKPNNAQQGVYMQVGPFSGTVDRAGMAVEFSADTNGSVVFVLPQNSWFGGSNGVPAGVHNVISPAGIVNSARYEAGEVNTSSISVGSLTGIRYIEVTVDRIRNAIAMFVDGVMVREVIDAAAIPMIGSYVVWEFFSGAQTTVVLPNILSLWASAGGPSRIPAAVPMVANREANKVGVQVKHFGTGTAMNYPLGTTAYTVVHADFKMSVKFPASGKLLLSLDARLVSTAQTLIKLSASSYATQVSNGAYNGHIHVSTFISGTPFSTVEVFPEAWVLGASGALHMGGTDGITTFVATPIESGV